MKKKAKSNDTYYDRFLTSHTPRGKARRFRTTNRRSRAESILRKFHEGQTVKSLSNEYGVSKQAIHQAIRKLEALQGAGV